jgi:hypothetical protein
MGKATKERFTFATRQLKAGTASDDARALQAILSQLGYLRRDRDPGRMCDCTCAALRYGISKSVMAYQIPGRPTSRPCLSSSGHAAAYRTLTRRPVPVPAPRLSCCAVVNTPRQI